MNKNYVHLGVILNCVLVMSAVAGPAADAPLSFPDALFAEKDYYRAITEYKRVAHLHPATDVAANARYMIGLSYFRGEKWDAAQAAFQQLNRMEVPDPLARRALLMMGECAYRNGDYGTALDLFQTFAVEHPEDPKAEDAGMRMAQSYVHLEKEPFAVQQAERMITQDPPSERVARMHTALQEIDRIPRKSPRLAGALSAVLPGAGQLYTGRSGDALLSFLLNSGLIIAAVVAFNNDEPVAGGLIAAVELTWYSGNIYGAVNAAHKYNRDQRSRFIENLDFQCGIMKD
ncbi:MAG TPA: hypothetical protein DCS43_06590, partial [Verrucomicrobia bacterium]|nr:hypothetical protein [Verrucomicrobiota bacterium]